MENSPFARLPAALREQIYSLTLIQPHDVWVGKGRYQFLQPSCTEEIIEHYAYSDGPHQLALAQTCRRIRNESIGLFFALNTFHVESDIEVGPWYCFERFLDIIAGEHANMLRAIRIDLEDSMDAFQEYYGYPSPDWLQAPWFGDPVQHFRRVRQWSLQYPQTDAKIRIGKQNDPYFPWEEDGFACSIDVRQLVAEYASYVETDDDGNRRREVIDEFLSAMREVTVESHCGIPEIKTRKERNKSLQESQRHN